MQKVAREDVDIKKTFQIIKADTKYAKNYDFAVKLYPSLRD